MKDLNYIPNHPNTGGWQHRHLDAVMAPRGFETAIVGGIKAWLAYAAEHAARYEDGIGNDNFLGDAWEQWGRALRTLLNGDCGRLDCGTLDSIIIDNLIEQGFGE